MGVTKMTTFHRGEDVTEILDEEIVEHEDFVFMFGTPSNFAMAMLAIDGLQDSLIKVSKRKTNDVQNERNQKDRYRSKVQELENQIKQLRENADNLMRQKENEIIDL